MRGRFRYIAFLVLLLCLFEKVEGQQTVVFGKVIDKSTGEPLPFVNIYFKNSKIGTTSDMEGNYYIETYYATDSLVASFIGYIPQSKKVKKDVRQQINFELEPGAIQMEEFVVKYTGNPAEEILERVIENKPANNREKYETYQYEVYNKVEFDLNNIPQELKEKKIFKQISFIFDNIDSSEKKPYLPIFISEAISQYYYRKNPKTQREYIKATKVSGIKNESINQFLGDMYQNVNIYDNYLNIFGKNFVSPVADGGLRFYKYYLTDSSWIDGLWCYKIEFKPRYRMSPVFEGEMWIHDTTYAVKSVKAYMNKNANINFINEFYVEQEYVFLEKKYWMLKKDRLIVDFQITSNDKVMGMYGRKTTSYKNILVNRPIPDQIFGGVDDIIVEPDADKKDEKFWDRQRHEQLSEQEKAIYDMVDSLKNVPIVRSTIEIVSMILTGYKEWGKFEIGQYFTFISYNRVENWRFKFGGRTSNQFSRWIEFSGYGAYGTGDNEWKYMGGMRVRLSKNPFRVMGVSYKKDLEQLGQSPNAFQVDNILASFLRRSPNIKLTMVNELKYYFENEWFQGFTTTLFFRNRILSPRGILSYEKYASDQSIVSVNSITNTDVSLYLRFAYKEKYVSGEFTRMSLGSKYPVLEAQITRGLKNILSGQYDYWRFDIGLKDEWRIGVLGNTEWRIGVGQILGKLPYPLLELHQGNETYFYDPMAFNLMNYFEFASDRWASLMITHHFQGYFFNHIPLLRRLKWREVATFKGVIGSRRQDHMQELIIPSNMFTLEHPYMEASIGVENIFRLFRIDALWRMTHLNNPNIAKFNIRTTFEIGF
ncbi:MAG: membrane protein [Vicingaceae bacterium]|nr:MAG: membrane protein [Vicingaceae bacterium]